MLTQGLFICKDPLVRYEQAAKQVLFMTHKHWQELPSPRSPGSTSKNVFCLQHSKEGREGVSCPGWENEDKRSPLAGGRSDFSPKSHEKKRPSGKIGQMATLQVLGQVITKGTERRKLRALLNETP